MHYAIQNIRIMNKNQNETYIDFGKTFLIEKFCIPCNMQRKLRKWPVQCYISTAVTLLRCKRQHIGTEIVSEWLYFNRHWIAGPPS